MEALSQIRLRNRRIENKTCTKTRLWQKVLRRLDWKLSQLSLGLALALLFCGDSRQCDAANPSKQLMKLFFSPKVILCLSLLRFGLFSDSALAATFSVSPSTISNTYSGAITLTVGGLTNGEMVIIDKYFDLNTNNIIDDTESLVQSFQVTDGLVSTIGGKTNLSVPYDSNPAASNITTLLNFYSLDNADHICGKYAFKLSSPTARFPAITNFFTVTNYNYLQSFTGLVKSGTTNITNAVVILFDSNHGLGGAGVADNSGSYTIKAAPGTYQLVAFRSNYVSEVSAPFVTLGAGATITTNVNVVLATRTISGKIVDAANTNTGLPGFFFNVRDTNRVQVFTWMDSNGNFTARVTTGQWQIRPQGNEVAALGYVGLDNGTIVDTTSGDVTGVLIALPKVTAMFYGSVKDNLNNPLLGVRFYGNDNNQYSTDATGDGNGNYAAGVTAGNWQVQIDDQNPSLANYIFSQGLGQTNINNGQALLQNFVAKLATNTISGYVTNNSNVPVVGVDVYAYDEMGYSAQNVTTDTNGFYSLKVANGTWHVSPNCGCSDCGHSLTSMGYQCVNEQIVNISNGNGAASFTVFPCGALQITTTNLSDGEVGINYDVFLNASSCNNSFTWSLNSGSLPPGLQLNLGGEIFGTPNSSGTFNFTVQVNDQQANTTNKNLSITILSAVQITTTSLPAGMVSQNIHTNLQATGGQPPYTWSLVSGSLPPGVIFNSGLIDGIPTNSGTFNFTIQVTDQLGGTTNQSLSLTINGSAQPLQVTTTFLPGGTTGTFYSNQVSATGGQLPYSWSLTPGSSPLPPGLNLSGSGILSGTPTNGGSFGFFLRVTDAALTTADSDFLSITIANPPLLVPSTNLPGGTVGVIYNRQLLATGGQPPYTWALAPGSLPVPAGLNLGTNGVISGTPTTTGTNSFIVRATDLNFSTANRSMTIVINPKPTLGSPSKISSNQFQLRLTGVSNQNYTIQYSTTLTTWISFSTNNSPSNSFNIIDSNATNGARFYRAVIGP